MQLEYNLDTRSKKKQKISKTKIFTKNMRSYLWNWCIFFASVRYSLHLCYHRQICEKYYLFRCDVCAQYNVYDIQ